MALTGPNIAGKYRIVSELGKGSAAGVVVYEAVHLTLGHRVAIKVLLEPETAAADSETVSRLLRQARAAANIKSKHVAQVYDLDVTKQQQPFVVMELLDEGIELAEFLAEAEADAEPAPLPIEDAVRYALQICHAIADAHAQSLVHGNLKPETIFLKARRGVPPIAKVLDFGQQQPDANQNEEDDVRAIVTILRKMLGRTKLPAALEEVLVRYEEEEHPKGEEEEQVRRRTAAGLAEDLLPFAPPGLEELVVETIATAAAAASPSASFGISSTPSPGGGTGIITTSRLRNMLHPGQAAEPQRWGTREWLVAALLGILLLFAGIGVSALARR